MLRHRRVDRTAARSDNSTAGAMALGRLRRCLDSHDAARSLSVGGGARQCREGVLGGGDILCFEERGWVRARAQRFESGGVHL